MRDIIFHGKRKDNGEWVEGDLMHGVQHQNGKAYIWQENADDLIGIKEYEIIPETVGQYTGLTDKNGKKIFEGDIVKFGRNIYQIIFECGSFALLDVDGEMITKIGGMNDHCYSLMNLYLECCWEDDCAYDIEIIDNIHDNPELLRQNETF